MYSYQECNRLTEMFAVPETFPRIITAPTLADWRIGDYPDATYFEGSSEPSNEEAKKFTVWVREYLGGEPLTRRQRNYFGSSLRKALVSAILESEISPSKLKPIFVEFSGFSGYFRSEVISALFGIDNYEAYLALFNNVKPDVDDIIDISQRDAFENPIKACAIIEYLKNFGWIIGYEGVEVPDSLTKFIKSYSAQMAKIAELTAENAELAAENAELRLLPPGAGGPDYEAAKLRFNFAKTAHRD